jgi:hypothetical protein
MVKMAEMLVQLLLSFLYLAFKAPFNATQGKVNTPSQSDARSTVTGGHPANQMPDQQ